MKMPGRVRKLSERAAARKAKAKKGPVEFSWIFNHQVRGGSRAVPGARVLELGRRPPGSDQGHHAKKRHCAIKLDVCVTRALRVCSRAVCVLGHCVLSRKGSASRLC